MFRRRFLRLITQKAFSTGWPFCAMSCESVIFLRLISPPKLPDAVVILSGVTAAGKRRLINYAKSDFVSFVFWVCFIV